MKNIFIFILLCFILACSKNDIETTNIKYTNQDVFNALIGTWKPNKYAYDVNLSEPIALKDNDPWFKYRVTFNTDSIMISKHDSITVSEKGRFGIGIGGYSIPDTVKIIVLPVPILSAPNLYQSGAIILDHFTDSTLVFSGAGSNSNGFAEFKRVK